MHGPNGSLHQMHFIQGPDAGDIQNGPYDQVSKAVRAAQVLPV